MELYRYEYTKILPGVIELDLKEFEVVQQTEKSWWIIPKSYLAGFGDPTAKRINKIAIRQYAAKTKMEALEEFLGRKIKQRGALQTKLDEVQLAIDLATHLLDSKTTGESTVPKEQEDF